MIATLIPFLLAARLEPPNSMSWKNGTEVTYLIQNDATILHSGEPDCTNINFHLHSLFSCQQLNSSLYCHFHETFVDSTPVDEKQRKLRKHIIEDLWTKKSLQQEIVQISYGKNGKGVILVPVEVAPVVRDMMGTLARLLIHGVDLSTRQAGNFVTPSNITSEHCRTHYFITRSAPSANKKSSIFELFLIPQPNESLTRSLEIEQYVEDPDCVDKSQWYSFCAVRELRKIDPMDVETELISAENFIVMDNHNFTSFSKVNTIIKNLKKKTKYVVDESISLTLQKIDSPEIPSL